MSLGVSSALVGVSGSGVSHSHSDPLFEDLAGEGDHVSQSTRLHHKMREMKEVQINSRQLTTQPRRSADGCNKLCSYIDCLCLLCSLCLSRWMTSLQR